MLTHERLVDLIWIFLITLTLISTWLAEKSLEPGIGITLFVALTIGVKGRLIIDHFMELTHANRRIRNLMYLYFYVIPAIVILTYLFGGTIARLTAIN